MGLLVTGLISGGLTIEATGIAEGTLEAITVLSGIGSGLEDYNSCVNDRNLVSCIAGGLSIIGVGGSFAAALGGSELLVADGEAVAFEAGGTGGLIDAFQLSGAAGASGNSACSVDITRDGSVRVPEKMGWEPS
jgi:hypothetical protein